MGLFDGLALQGISQGLLGGREKQIAQQNVLTQQGLQRREQDIQKFGIDEMKDRQSRLASLQYANSIGEKLLDPNFRADVTEFGTLPDWEAMQQRHYLYGTGQYGSSILNRDTPLPNAKGVGLGDATPRYTGATGDSGPANTGVTPKGSGPTPDTGLNIIVPEHLGGSGASLPGEDPGADTRTAGGSMRPGSPLPPVPADSISAPGMANFSRLSAVDAADQEGNPETPETKVEGSRQQVTPDPGLTTGLPKARDNGEPGQYSQSDLTQQYPPTQVSAQTASIKVPAPGTEGGVDAGLFQNQLIPSLEATRQVMEGNYSSDRRLAAAAQYTGTITQMLSNQLSANQIVQLREQIALLPAKAQAALIETLAKAAETNANAKATLDLIIPTALKFKGEAFAAGGQGILSREEANVLPTQVRTGRIAAEASASTAHAANISAQASQTEATNRGREVTLQIRQWGEAPGRAAAATYFNGLVQNLYETRYSGSGGGFGAGGSAKVLKGVAEPQLNLQGQGHASNQYKVLNVGAAIQLVAAGFPGAWAALSTARTRGVDSPGGSSTPIPDDDTLRGAVLAINGAQAALQAAGPPGSKGYQQTFALIRRGQEWLSTVPDTLQGKGTTRAGTTYDTGGKGGNSVSDRIQGGLNGGAKNFGNWFTRPTPTINGQRYWPFAK